MRAVSPIASGTYVRNGETGGRIGIVVEDADRRTLALTAAQVLAGACGEAPLCDAATGKPVGAPYASLAMNASSGPLWRLIGAIELSAPWLQCISRSPPQSALAVLPPRSSPPAPGARVYKIESPTQRVAAMVVGIGCVINVHDPSTQQYRTFVDVVEIEFAEQPERHLRRGEAGSLVADEDGAVIGLLVAGSGNIGCVALLYPYLTSHGLALWAPPTDAGPADFAAVLLEALDVGMRASLLDAGFSDYEQLSSDYEQLGTYYIDLAKRILSDPEPDELSDPEPDDLSNPEPDDISDPEPDDDA